MKSVKITKDNQQMLANRYDLDLAAFPIDYNLVTNFGDNGQDRYQGVITDAKLDELFVKVTEIENGFWEIKPKNS